MRSKDRNALPSNRPHSRSRCDIVRLVGIAVLATSCVSDRSLSRSEGSFTLTATGAGSFEARGIVRAGYSHPMEGTGFSVGLEVPDTLSTAPVFASAVIGLYTTSLPGAGQHAVLAYGDHASTGDGRLNALIGKSGSSFLWESDSGHVYITRAARDGSLAGEFSITFRCSHCGPLDPAVPLHIAGSFTTRAVGQ